MDRIGDDFEQVWRQQRDRLWRIAWLICGDADLADDVIAAAAARSWRGWSRRGVREPEPYLRRAVVNEATDRFRARGREHRWFGRRLGDGRGQRAVEDQAADRADLALALARLPVGQRAVVVLRYWADLSEAATADALSISPGTVKSRTSRALAALAADLGGVAPAQRPEEASDA
jgi:RNA polymerase sigma-70 factor (ECF subfamily)